MNLVELIDKLNNAQESFIIEDELSLEDLKEVLSHPKSSYVLNLAQIVMPFLFNEEILYLAEKIAKENESFRDQVVNFADIPEILEEEYLIKESRFKNNFFKLDLETSDNLKALDVESIKIRVKRNKRSIAEFYPIKESANSLSFIKTLGVNLALVGVLAAFTASDFSLAGNPFSSKSQVSKGTFSGVSIGENFNSVLEEISKSNNPLLVKVHKDLTNLSEQDIENLNDIANLNVNLPVKQMTDQEIKAELVEVINSFYVKPVKNADSIANAIVKYSYKHQVDYKLMLAIIKNESDFKQSAVSRTGDISISQIRVPVWKEEFANRKLRPLDAQKLKKDSNYAIDRMAEIISILEDKWKEEDPYWYARYHSRTDRPDKPLKSNYAKKVQKVLAHITIQELEGTDQKLDNLLLSLKSISLDLAADENLDYEKIQKLKEQITYMKKTITAQISLKRNYIVAANK